MSFVKKKQIYGLTEDLNNLYFASPVFKRDTTLSGATPSIGEASLDASDADEVSEVKIYTTDSSIGNHYSFLNELKAGDKVIIKAGSSFSIYLINSISSEVDSSTNEGYFILTTQHSFGYTGSFSPGELVFYFRKSISAEIDNTIGNITNNSALIASEKIAREAATAAEAIARSNEDNNLQSQITTLQNTKFVADVTLNSSSATTVTHSLGTTDIIVQLKNDSGSMVVDATIDNYQDNSVDIQTQTNETFRVIIMK